MSKVGGNTLVRGGQTTLHAWRMAWQVIRQLAWAGVLLTLVVAAADLAANTTAPQWHAAWVRLLAAFDWGLTRDPARTMSVSAGGRTVVVPVRQILADPNIAAAEVRLKRQILASLAVGGWTALGGVAVLLGIFAHRGRRLKQKRHVRGAKLVDRKRGVKLVPTTASAGVVLRGREIAGVPYPAGAETMGTLVSGTVGGGKTQIFMGLIDQARRRGDRAIVYDKMGVFARAFYDPARDVVLNPLDARSPFWSPCLEARIASDLDAMAAAILEHQDSPDPFWSLAAWCCSRASPPRSGKTACGATATWWTPRSGPTSPRS